MQKVTRSCVLFLLLIALILGSSLSVFAAGTVSYDGDAHRFVFNSGSNQALTDLFTEFKGLMPGDSVRQEITVRNDASYGVKVKLYVRSLGADEASADFLSKLHLTVAKAENNKMAYMFDAAADQTAQMTDWVYLGTLYSGGEVNLVLNLEIPIELDDRYQDAIGTIDWEFKAEELPIDPDDPTPPQTGDQSLLYVAALLASLCGIGVLALCRYRQKAAA